MSKEKEIIEEVIRTLKEDADIERRYSAELDNFNRRLVLSESNIYRLGVIGVTSSGKSTMINALLGEELLPSGARPTSSQLVSCFKGEKRYAKIFFENGTEKMVDSDSLTRAAIEKYGDEGFNEQNKEKVRMIEISSPNFPISRDIVLVDSPGLDAFGYEGHEELTMNNFLPTIDFCIFVTTCKSNSDEKTLSVLNTVADHEKPIIIVQNMIDSILPSVDGKKTKEDVAQEHKNRVQKIIGKSKIIDKSNVAVVQISARYAIKAQICENRDESEKLLKDSNYEKLISSISNISEQLRPRVEGARMENLRREVLRISNVAIEVGEGVTDVSDSEYENIRNEFEMYKKHKKKVKVKIQQALGRIKKLSEDLKSYGISAGNTGNVNTAFTIDNVNTDLADVKETITSQIKRLNQSIIAVCERLNVDSRSIVSDFRFENSRVSVKEKQETHLKWVEGKRHWYTLWLKKDEGHWESSIGEKVYDEAATVKNAIKVINKDRKVYDKTLSNWDRSIAVTEEKMKKEVANREIEFKNRRERILDGQKSLKIGETLKRIADHIPHNEILQTPVQPSVTDVEEKIVQAEFPQHTFSVYELAERYRESIHKFTIDAFINKEASNTIIGWDEPSELRLAKYFFGIDSEEGKIKIIHNPSCSIATASHSGRNHFILVNAIQYGSALNELKTLGLSLLDSGDNVYFVIQDFQEIINGNAVDETLENMHQIYTRLQMDRKGMTLILHDNPIYNLAAIEACESRCSTQTDEIEILGALQKGFPFLFPKGTEERNRMEGIIRSITQKFGMIWNEK